MKYFVFSNFRLKFLEMNAIHIFVRNVLSILFHFSLEIFGIYTKLFKS